MEGCGELGGGEGGSAQPLSSAYADAGLPAFDHLEAQDALDQVPEGAVCGGGDADWAKDLVLLPPSTPSSPGFLASNMGPPQVGGDAWGSGD
jgi:hypothetical protein